MINKFRNEKFNKMFHDKTPLFKNYEGEVHTKDEWLWIINNDPMRNGTPEEVFQRCLIKKLIVRFR